MCVLSIKVPIWKKSGNLLCDPCILHLVCVCVCVWVLTIGIIQTTCCILTFDTLSVRDSIIKLHLCKVDYVGWEPDGNTRRYEYYIYTDTLRKSGQSRGGGGGVSQENQTDREEAAWDTVLIQNDKKKNWHLMDFTVFHEPLTDNKR